MVYIGLKKGTLNNEINQQIQIGPTLNLVWSNKLTFYFFVMISEGHWKE